MPTSTEDFSHDLRLSHFTMKNLPDAAIWVDSEANILRVNKMACSMLGYSKDELLSLSIFDLDPKESQESWQKRWADLKQHKTLRMEKFDFTKDQRWIPIELVQHYFEFEGKEYCCSFMRDITERNKVLNDLNESQRKLFTLINNLPGSVYRCAPDLTFQFLTDWTEKITGFAKEETFKQKKFSNIYPEDKLSTKRKFNKIIRERQSGHLIFRILTKDDEVKWVMDRFQGVYNEENELVAVEGFFADITPQVKAEQKLKNALADVEHFKEQLEEQNIYLRQEIKLTHNFENIIYQSEVFRDVLTKVEQVAVTDATVLILGESGTGKELIARAVHSLSDRKQYPLVKVNCAALPANLIESELFGHEKGAFTGALTQKIGRFELADGGTLFLDEVGEMPLELQSKLLRVLQEGEFERLGNPKTRKVDVRIIAATNRDLKKSITQQTFREDLYYRLNVFPVHLPALRDRPEDIPLLVNHFIFKYSKKIGKQINKVSKRLMDKLTAYPWPGNVRELENIVERAIIISPKEKLEMGDWLPQKRTEQKSSALKTLNEVEKQYILEVLNHTQWRVRGKNGASEILDIKPTTLESRMQKTGNCPKKRMNF